MSEHSVWEDGFFKIDPECHIIGDMSSVEHFPGVQMWWRAIDGIMRPTLQGAPGDYISKFEPWEMTKSADPENILRAMDKYGVDVACILPESMMDTTGFTSRWCTNGDAWKAVQTHPDRFILNPNLSPIKRRGVKNAIWELEYWMDQGAKIFKYYSPRIHTSTTRNCGLSISGQRNWERCCACTRGSVGCPPERANTATHPRWMT